MGIILLSDENVFTMAAAPSGGFLNLWTGPHSQHSTDRLLGNNLVLLNIKVHVRSPAQGCLYHNTLTGVAIKNTPIINLFLLSTACGTRICV